jgi:phage terminase large subunit-like protein
VTAAKVEVDPAGNRKLSKRKATGRIDPLVALTMAVGISTTKVEPTPSYQFFVLAR